MGLLFVRGPAAIVLAASIVVAAPTNAQGPLKDENILMPVPPGFKLASHQENRTSMISEFTPENETVDNWTKLITEQIFRGLGRTTAKGFAEGMAQRMPASCPGAVTRALNDTVENGYPVSTWSMACPRNPGTGQPEMFVIKVIQGNDALYAVQYAFKRDAEQALVDEAVAFLRQVVVCDTRRRDRACPVSPSATKMPQETAANPVAAFLRAADNNDTNAMKSMMDRNGERFMQTIKNCYLRRVYGNDQTREITAAWMCAEGPNRSRVVLAGVTVSAGGKIVATVQANTTNNRPAPARTGSAFAE